MIVCVLVKWFTDRENDHSLLHTLITWIERNSIHIYYAFSYALSNIKHLEKMHRKFLKTSKAYYRYINGSWENDMPSLYHHYYIIIIIFLNDLLKCHLYKSNNLLKRHLYGQKPRYQLELFWLRNDMFSVYSILMIKLFIYFKSIPIQYIVLYSCIFTNPCTLVYPWYIYMLQLFPLPHSSHKRTNHQITSITKPNFRKKIHLNNL